MRVMVTGGTGFVGGHTVAALLVEGHEPHLLVRDVEKPQRLCQLHALDPGTVSFTLGDLLDEGSVLAALDRCDACIHAAAAVPFGKAGRSKVFDSNAAGARIVLDAAVAAGCDPVIHVSSLGVIFPPTGPFMSADDPVQVGGGAYLASKAEADMHARGLQADGHPVVIVYPSGVAGPKDLAVNSGETTMANVLQAPFDIRAPSGGDLFVDVRDLASALARLLQPGRGPRRYLAGGNFLTWDEFAAHLERATGVSRPVVDMTEQDMMARFHPETARYVMGLKPSDDGPLQRDAGVSWRPYSDTLTDLLAWMALRPT
jgi:nucleoside-diphosphate-sugar epimerase